MLKVVVCPGERVTGKVNPLMLNPVPLIVPPEIVRLEPPLLLRVSDWLWDIPDCTLPKFTFAGVAVSCPDAGVCASCFPTLTPWQPMSAASAKRTTSTPTKRRLFCLIRGLRWLLKFLTKISLPFIPEPDKVPEGHTRWGQQSQRQRPEPL